MLEKTLRVIDYIASKRLTIIGVVLLVVFILDTLVVVYKAGYEDGLRKSVGTLQSLDAVRVQFDVEALSLIRAQDVDSAVRFLEEDLDATTVTLPGSKPFSELPPDVQRSLVMAKAYHLAFPPEGRYADRVQQILNAVQPSDSYDPFENSLGRLVDQQKADIR